MKPYVVTNYRTHWIGQGEVQHAQIAWNTALEEDGIHGTQDPEYNCSMTNCTWKEGIATNYLYKCISKAIEEFPAGFSSIDFSGGSHHWN